MRNYTDRNIGTTKESNPQFRWGVALLTISLFILFCMVINFLPFIRSFILGCFGLSAYPIIIALALISFLILKDKRYKFAKSYLFSLIGLYFIIITFFQLTLTNIAAPNLSEYLTQIYNAKITAGGVVSGFFAYLLGAGLNLIGAYIMLMIFAILCFAVMFDHFLKLRDYEKINARALSFPEKLEVNTLNSPKKVVAQQAVKNQISEPDISQNERIKPAKETLLEKMQLEAKHKNPIFKNFAEQNTNASQSSDNMAEMVFGKSYRNLVNNKENTISTYDSNDYQAIPGRPAQVVHQDDTFNLAFEPIMPGFDNTNYNYTSPQNIFQQANTPEDNTISLDDELSKIFEPVQNIEDSFTNNLNVKPKEKFNKIEQIKMQQVQPTPYPTTNYKRPSPYVSPPLSLLTTESTSCEDDNEDYEEKARILEGTLESFKISAKVVSIIHGPAVTRYELEMPVGVPVKKVAQHSDDIAYAMRSSSGVRIEAPIPGKNRVGVEIPNENIATVGLRDIIESPEFTDNKAPLTMVLGKDIAGTNMTCDMSSMPHLLVAGATGSGKSVCLNVLLISLIYKLGPDDLRLIMIDPKRVEFTSYNGLPHLLTPEVITQKNHALRAFDWAINEMDERFKTFQRLRVRDIKEYNSLEAVYKGKEPKMPRIIIIVDELADLMMMARKDLEEKIMRIAQLSRAAGIHLILATQRPSVDIITGTIKANLPSRIAFAVTTFADSNTIISQGGAEKLLGKGDSLYSPQNLPEPVRVQCPFISGKEVCSIVDYIKEHNEADFDEIRTKRILNGNDNKGGDALGNGVDNGIPGAPDIDPLVPAVLQVFIEQKCASISLAQRKFSVGYARAARIVDQIEQAGYISSSDGSNKNRKVLIDQDKYNELFNK